MNTGDLNAMDLLDRINSSIKTELQPLTSKIEALDTKVSELYKDRVTRGDLEKLSIAFVPRDAYEARHSQLIERDKYLEDTVRQLQKDHDADILRLENLIKQQQEIQLSSQDRNWIRTGQIMGALGLIGAAVEFLLSHVHLQ